MNRAITSDLIEQLQDSISNAKALDIVVSFIQYSGFAMIQELLQEAMRKEIPIRVLTSTYMNITDPTALFLLYDELGPGKVRLYNGMAPSFHPKAYFFHGISTKDSKVFVGSSNLSKAALTKGVEWNYCLEGEKDSEAIELFSQEFERLYRYESYELQKEHIQEYRETYRVPSSIQKNAHLNEHFNQHRQKSTYPMESTESSEVADIVKTTEPQKFYRPNAAQQEALAELRNTRAEGNDKAIVVAATGIGKTFLAAFDSEEYDSVLFVAHREEILQQAYETFAKVRGAEHIGRLFGEYQEKEAKFLFATVQSLTRDHHLSSFAPNAFSYVVVDEIHHGTAPSYRKIIDYFQPKFLLGLTATPHRMDSKDVFSLCDYNRVYEVDLFSAINRGWLVPYKYYGIYDATVDYQNITWLNGKYVEKELEKALSISKRAELIIKQYRRYRRKRALAFCSSIAHAEFMASEFNANGIKSICIHSDSSRENYCHRKSGIESLEKGEIEVIFSVDMLSEGTDIPSLDMLLFLRPTESPTVFLQQLGRGLRLYQEKEDVRVLDFIGNFRKLELLPALLGKRSKSEMDLIRQIQNGDDLPMDCQVDFEFEVIDLLEKALRAQKRVREKIRDWYLECCEETGRSIDRKEFFIWLDEEQYQVIKKSTANNPFRDFLRYRQEWNTSDTEKILIESFLDSNEYHFLHTIETTSMAQLYKLPVFACFIENGSMKERVEKNELIQQFKDFYRNNRNRQDLSRNKSTKEVDAMSDEKWWRLINDNPLHFLAKTHHDIFSLEEDGFRINLQFNWINGDKVREEWFIHQVRDAIEFRREEFLDQRLERA